MLTINEVLLALAGAAAAAALTALLVTYRTVQSAVAARRASPRPAAFDTPWVSHVRLEVALTGREAPLSIDPLSPRPTPLTVHGLATGDSFKPLMLCLHGFPESAWSYRSLLAAFADSHHVVAIDMPGYGRTGQGQQPATFADASGASVRSLVRAVQGVMHALGRDHIDVLVGHDWGGVVAWSFAMAHPTAVTKLVVLACPHPVAFAQNFTLSQAIKSAYMLFFNLPILPEAWLTARDGAEVKALIGAGRTGVVKRTGPNALREEDTDVAAWSSATNPTWALNYYRAMLRGLVWGALCRLLGRRGERPAPRSPLPMPVLLLWGEKDAFLQPSLMDGTAHLCTPATFQSHVFPGASHWLAQDEVEGVVDAIAAFAGVSERAARTGLKKLSRAAGRGGDEGR
jgi:pimeloyl-ACP methyl ester carboxylesterase